MKEIENKIKELEIVVKDSTRQLEILKECLKIINPLRYPGIFDSNEDLETWLDKNNIEYQNYCIFVTRDWMYTDGQGFEHLYREGKELTLGIKAKNVFSYGNGDWEYEDENGNCRQFDKSNNEIK